MNDINIVDELKDLLNEYINIMCVTEDIEQLKSMKKGQFIVSKNYMILIIKK